MSSKLHIPLPQLVLELLHSQENGISVPEICLQVDRKKDAVEKCLNKLKAAGVAFKISEARGNIPGRWKRDASKAHLPQQTTPERLLKAAARQRAARIMRTVRAEELRWERTAADRKDEAEQRWLNHALQMWSGWMHAWNLSRLSFPRSCTVVRGGWLVREAEELHEQADRRVIEAVDAIISGLPESQRAAVWIAWGLATGPEGAWCVDKYQAARASIFAEADRRGVVVL